MPTDTWTPAPTPQRRRQSEILAPRVDQAANRQAWEVIDPLTRYGSHLSQASVDALRRYTDARIRVETASFTLGSYDVHVDGWKTEIDSDTGATCVEKDAAEIARLHQQLSRELRPLADALIAAVMTPQRPCPFEMRVGKAAVIPVLNLIAEQLLRRNNIDDL